MAISPTWTPIVDWSNTSLWVTPLIFKNDKPEKITNPEIEKLETKPWVEQTVTPPNPIKPIDITATPIQPPVETIGVWPTPAPTPTIPAPTTPIINLWNLD